MRAKLRRHQGQAAVEYVLLVLICVLVFGWLFYQIRRDLFRLWVCEIGPRVQSPVPCRFRDDCFDRISEITTPMGKDKIQKQRRLCNSLD
jgi:hypothetical protein